MLKKEKIEAFWVWSGLFEYHHNRLHQELSWKLFEILRCAFNVLSDVEKMRYWDVRNGVEKFRVCTFWRVGRQVQWTGKKTAGFDPPPNFPKFLSRHIIFYDKVDIGHKFLYPLYGARIWARRSHPPNFRQIWHFQICSKSRGWPRNLRLLPRTCSDPLG